MPRQKNTKSTSIYWLYDIRPETTASGWPNGKPFYCGKTVESPQCRLRSHRNKPHGSAARSYILECGEFVHVRTMEVVPVEQDWCARERYWIATMRVLYPGCCLNVSDGGEGPGGLIHSAETRAKISIANRGRKLSPETCARISAAMRGRKHPLGGQRKECSPETRAKMSASKKGTKRSAETRAKISAARLGMKIASNPDHVAKRAAANRGKKRSLEIRAKMRAAWERRRAAALQDQVPTSPTS